MVTDSLSPDEKHLLSVFYRLQEEGNSNPETVKWAIKWVLSKHKYEFTEAEKRELR